jgi:Excalibur calcium-binding domain
VQLPDALRWTRQEWRVLALTLAAGAPIVATLVLLLAPLPENPGTAFRGASVDASSGTPVGPLPAAGPLTGSPVSPDGAQGNSAVSTAPAASSAPVYSSCADARADGRASIPQSDRAYRPALDRDGDGVACDNGDRITTLVVPTPLAPPIPSEPDIGATESTSPPVQTTDADPPVEPSPPSTTDAPPATTSAPAG